MSEVIAHIKLLLYHRYKAGVVFIVTLECFEHHPFSVFLRGVHIVVLLVPLGQVLYFGPFFVLRQFGLVHFSL